MRNSSPTRKEGVSLLKTVTHQEELKVVELYNRAADRIGVPRPLDLNGWDEIKDHLKVYIEGLPDYWTEEEVRLHRMALT
jgi:hypothetical protein